MRFLYAKFIGYIGFYNGIGKSEFSIDFRRCKNNICVIHGANGTGKSTLLKALNLMPDRNENFVPNLDASKELILSDGSNMYNIFIIHPLDKKNNRQVSKASICKNGIELNPNGNISSYKEIIFDEFGLDSNYIALSRISGDDRGLADKTPAERKRFISSIISNLETYNNIYKNLNKKTNTLNSYINNLSYKIQNIGDENYLNTSRDSILSRYNNIKKEIELLSAKLVSDQTILKVNDPTLSIQSEWDNLKSSIDIETSNYDKLNSFLTDFYNKHGEISTNKDDIKVVIENSRKKIDDIKTTISEFTSIQVNAKNISIQSKNDIDRYNNKILNIDIDSNGDKLKEKLDETKDRIDNINSQFKEYNIKDIDNISTSEIDQIIKIIYDMIKTVDTIYEYLPVNDMENYCDIKLNSNQSINNLINSNIEDTSMITNNLHYSETELSKILADKDTANLLNIRPGKCDIDSCPFISASLDVLKKYDNKKDNIDKRISEIQLDIDNYNKKLKENEDDLKILRSYLSTDTCLDALNAKIVSNYDIISKFSKIIQITDFRAIIMGIRNRSMFNDIRDSISIIDNLKNNIVIYKSISKVYDNLQSQYNIYENKKSRIDEYNDEINKCNSIIEKQEDIYNEYNIRIKDQRYFLEKESDNLDDYSIADKKIDEFNKSKEKLDKYKFDFKIVNERIKSSADILKEVNDIKNKLLDYKTQLDPLEKQKTEIDSKLMMLSSFKQEYGEYKHKYDIIDVLKKYSTPTKAGIQSVFMSMYMDSTLDLANQLLGMIFNGEYRLMEYSINENEFRIPFVGSSGLPVDDISSGSTSQVCIMGMIINLVILNQASTKYNIASLDEIDGGLDHYNRMMFVDILQKLIQILHIDQLIIISHSVESALSNIDLIELSPVDEDDNFSGANIIYSYKEK